MKKIQLFFCSILLLSGLMSCGKITQVPMYTEENRSFDLTYTVEIVPTESIKILGKLSANNKLTTLDNPAYARVIGFSRANKQEELSWGKAVLLPALKADMSTINVGLRRKFKSQSFRKDGIELLQSDHTWTKLELTQGQLSWKGSSRKIERNYPLYMVCVYSAEKLAFKTISEARVTGNKTIDLGAISPYDTFISVLFLMAGDESPELSPSETVEKLKQLYPLSFYELLARYQPKNAVKRFDPANPIFEFDGNLEKTLVKIFNLSRKNKAVVTSVIQQLPSETLSDKAKESLIQTVQKL